MFFSRPQLKALAEAVKENEELWDDPTALSKAIDVPEILSHGHSLDVAAFGRMVADMPDINVDAAIQVSHALGTHSAPTQYDYFTAVDDSQGQEEAGAGMIGTVEFNSATVYRYATINVPALIDNMADEEKALEGLPIFIESFVFSLPTGKQNTFAAHTRPALVSVVIRQDRPVNYMSAFEKPVQAQEEGYVGPSVKAFADFVSSEANRWGDEPVATLTSCTASVEPQCEGLGELVTFSDLATRIKAVVTETLTHE